MIRTLAIGCPRWAIVTADLPPEHPAAVFLANRVVSSSPEALSFGIKRGMRRRDAQSRCPELEVLTHDPARDARTFERIVTIVESFAPRVEVVRPGLCVVASRGPARYFGGEEELRERVACAVDDTIEVMRTHAVHVDDRCRTGVADGPFAASLAAARGRVIPPLGSPAFLAPLSIDVLDRPDLCDLLKRLGIRNLGELAALPRHRVVARFGVDGEIAHRLACAHDDRLLEPRAIPPDLIVVRELDPPAHRVDVAMFAGKAAADELAERLMTLGLACAKLRITVTTEHGEERSRTWRYSAAFTPAAIAERVRWQLEGWLAEGAQLSGGISIVRLSPEDVGAATGAQIGLWSRRGDASDRVRRAIARVQGLLGQRGAQQPTLSGGRHPSEQVSLVAWGDPVSPARPGLPGKATVAGPVEVEMPPWPGRLPSPSPSIVHPRPMGAEMVDDQGEHVAVSSRLKLSASPTRVRINGKSGGTGGVSSQGWVDVVSWAGPWPMDERWWDSGENHRRARFQVSLADGTAHLMTLEGGCFHVEATYD